MDKSTTNVKSTINLSDMRTWQSGILQSSVHRNIKRLSDDYLKQYELTTMHWFILGAISDAGMRGIRITDLAEKVSTTLGYLTTAINALELKGMVVRVDHDTDSRTKLLSLSPTFEKQFPEIEEGLREIFRAQLYRKITRQELATYITVLQKLSDV